MTVLAIKSKEGKGLNCIEIFGLAKSGKTTFLKKLKEKGKEVYEVEYGNNITKIYNIIKYFIKKPIKTLYLFFKLNSNWLKLEHLTVKNYLGILKMRNSYLAGVLAKYEIVSKKDDIYVDEFILQSLFMIFHKRVDDKEIREVLYCLPKSKNILLFEEKRKVRFERLKKIKKPATNLDLYFKFKWQKNCEYNYKIIKKILLEEYEEEK